MASRRALGSFPLRALAAQSSIAIKLAKPAFATTTRRAQCAVRPVACHGMGRRWLTGSPKDSTEPPAQWGFDQVKQLAENRSKDGNVTIVDVREPVELFETGKIPGAINIPITTAVQSFHISDEDFVDMYGFERPSKKTQLLFYCKAGVRAHGAAVLAQHAGWKNVGEYPGSWLDWAAQKGPVEQVKGTNPNQDRIIEEEKKEQG